jgi:hypothetical protein
MFVMAGLVPAIPIHGVRMRQSNRDHRVTTLRVGPAMTVECVEA